MLDKALETMKQNQSYYFQLYPLSLYIVNRDSDVPAAGTTYRFTILKGQQKFDETRLPIETNFKKVNGQYVMVMPKCPINFFVPTFTKGRAVEFTFNMYQTENKTEYFIAEYSIEIEPYVKEYKNDRTVRFEHRAKFSEDYELQFEVYVEKSRFALEKVVKDYKVERTLKSPLRERKESPESKPTGPIRRTSPTGEKRTLVREPSQKSESRQSEKEQFATQLSQNKVISKKGSVLSQPKQKIEEPAEENFEEKVEEKPKATDRTTEEKTSEAAGPSEDAFAKKNKQKLGAPSETSSRKHMPNLEVKFKPVGNTTMGTSEIKMTQSQRMSDSTIISDENPLHKKDGDNKRERLFLYLFLAASMVLMYFSMHPNKKV